MLEFTNWLGRSGLLDWLVCVLHCWQFLSNHILFFEHAGKESRKKVSYNRQTCNLVRNDRISSLGGSEESTRTLWTLVRVLYYSVKHIWNHWENRIDVELSRQFREVTAEWELLWLLDFGYPHTASVWTASVNSLALGLFSATEGRLFIRVIDRERAYSKRHFWI